MTFRRPALASRAEVTKPAQRVARHRFRVEACGLRVALYDVGDGAFGEAIRFYRSALSE